MLSVVLCTYNGARFLRPQLKSLLQQTRPADEIVIQDDGSTDGTMEILHEFASEHPEIVHIYKNEGSNKGASANFYSAMQKAHGDLLAICDQDDIWEPDKLQIQERILLDSGKMLCTCRSKPFAENGAQAYYDPRSPNLTLMRMLHCAEIPGHTMMFRHELLELLPPDAAIVKSRMYDVVLSVIAAAANSIILADKVLVHQRRYVTATTYTPSEGQQPTAANARRLLLWCLRHYNEIKHLGAQGYLEWRELLYSLPFRSKTVTDAILLMELQSRSGLLNYLKTARICLRHRYEICHTPNSSFIAAIRAILFPLTSIYYKRGLLHQHP